MFIDFLTLVMINMIAATILLLFYLWKGMDEKDQRPYAAIFFMTGLLSFVTGLQISFTWPLPGSFNVVYGDAITLFGVVFLATSIALWQGWSFLPVAIYSFFAGLDAIIGGIRLYSLNLGSGVYEVVAAGFILTGLGGVSAFPFLQWFKNNKTVRSIAMVVLLVAAVIWFIVFCNAIWVHMATFANYVPVAK